MVYGDQFDLDKAKFALSQAEKLYESAKEAVKIAPGYL
jgi:hypothetical protein